MKCDGWDMFWDVKGDPVVRSVTRTKNIHVFDRVVEINEGFSNTTFTRQQGEARCIFIKCDGLDMFWDVKGAPVVRSVTRTKNIHVFDRAVESGDGHSNTTFAGPRAKARCIFMKCDGLDIIWDVKGAPVVRSRIRTKNIHVFDREAQIKEGYSTSIFSGPRSEASCIFMKCDGST